MAYIYILQSRKNGNYYVGCTDHFEQRMKQHREGKIRTTRRLLPVEVMLKQQCSDIQTAKKIERRIKKLKRRDYIQSIVRDGYIKIIDRI